MCWNSRHFLEFQAETKRNFRRLGRNPWFGVERSDFECPGRRKYASMFPNVGFGFEGTPNRKWKTAGSESLVFGVGTSDFECPGARNHQKVLEGSSPGPFPRNFPKVARHGPGAHRARRVPPGQRRGPSEWPWGGPVGSRCRGRRRHPGRRRPQTGRLERKCLRMLMMVVVRMVRMDAG